MGAEQGATGPAFRCVPLQQAHPRVRVVSCDAICGTAVATVPLIFQRGSPPTATSVVNATHLGLIDLHPWRVRHPRTWGRNPAMLEMTWAEMIARMEQHGRTMTKANLITRELPQATIIAYKWNTGWAAGPISMRSLSPDERRRKLTHVVDFPDGAFGVRLVDTTQIELQPASHAATQLPLNSWCAWSG